MPLQPERRRDHPHSPERERDYRVAALLHWPSLSPQPELRVERRRAYQRPGPHSGPSLRAQPFPGW